MGRPCTICVHAEQVAIDQALVEGTGSNRRIAAQYGVNEQSVRRHRAEHLPARLSTAHDADQVANAGDLLGQLHALRERTMTLLDKAERSGDQATALRGISEARKTIELLLEVEQQLDRRDVVNIIINPQWIDLRTVIVGALEPYPEARNAVAGALMAIEGRETSHDDDGRPAGGHTGAWRRPCRRARPGGIRPPVRDYAGPLASRCPA